MPDRLRLLTLIGPLLMAGGLFLPILDLGNGWVVTLLLPSRLTWMTGTAVALVAASSLLLASRPSTAWLPAGLWLAGWLWLLSLVATIGLRELSPWGWTMALLGGSLALRASLIARERRRREPPAPAAPNTA